jgi:hypothetical protein
MARLAGDSGRMIMQCRIKPSAHQVNKIIPKEFPSRLH